MKRGTLAISGATGFVGQTLTTAALAQGWHVRALARRPQAPREGVEWVEGALENAAALRSLALGAHAVIHVAGVVNAPDVAGFEAGNVAGTAAMLAAARDAGVHRFIHVSSLAAREPALSAYGASKARAEALVLASGLETTLVRPPAIYGPGDRDMLDLFKMARSGLMLMPPAGRISAIHVEDLAQLLLALVRARAVDGAVFEVDDGRAQGWSHAEFARAIGAAMGRRVLALSMPRALLGLAARGDRLVRGSGARLTPDRVAYFCHPDWVIDPARRPPATLWQPEVATPAGLAATAAAYRAAGWL